MTMQQISDRHDRYLEASAGAIIDQAAMIPDPGLRLRVAVTTGLAIGVELGLRAAILDPDRAMVIRDVITAEVRGDAGLNFALGEAQGWLDHLVPR